MPVVAKTEQADEKHTDQSLTLMETLKAAYYNNPGIQAARAEYQASLEQIDQALSRRRPSVSLNAGIAASRSETSGLGFVTGRQDNVSKEYGVSAEQSLFRGGRNYNDVSAVRHLADAQRYTLLDEENRLLLDVVRVYLDVFTADTIVRLNENNVTLLETQLEATQTRFDVGELTRTDVSLAQAGLSNAKAGLIRARGNLNVARAEFYQLSGLFADNLVFPYQHHIAIPDSLESSIETGLGNNVALGAVRQLYLSAEEDLDSVFGELWPELSLYGEYGKAFDPGSGALEEAEESIIGLRATMPLYLGGNIRSRIREGKYTSQQRRIEIQEAERAVRQAIIAAWDNLQTARAEIKARRLEVEASLTAREGTYQEALLGERTVLDSLDADQDLLSAQTDLVLAERDEILAAFSLLTETGQISNLLKEKDSPLFDYQTLMKKAGSALFTTDAQIIPVKE